MRARHWPSYSASAAFLLSPPKFSLGAPAVAPFAATGPLAATFVGPSGALPASASFRLGNLVLPLTNTNTGLVLFL